MGLDQWITYTTNDGEEHEFYYRKENWIRNWVVNNTSLDIDGDCEEVIIHPSQIHELHQACEQVLDNHELASELLPTSTGFFFGSTDYDKFYFESVELLKGHLEEIMDNDDKITKITYTDWW